jgi:hypothetical protein
VRVPTYSDPIDDAPFIGPPFTRGGVVKKLAVGLLGAVAVAATVLLVRQQTEVEPRERGVRLVPVGEAAPTISLERMRELGL